jgi:hypothetical protein
MRKNDTSWGFFVGCVVVSLIHGAFMAVASTVITHENDLLRFCMTHSIALEQCKIPEEGE